MPKADAQDIRPTAVQRGSATRDKLERAALALIAEVGWHNVTTRSVADRAGVGAGLVHYHYDSVQALLIAAVGDAAAELGDELLAALDGHADVPAGIAAMVTTVGGWDTHNPLTLVLIESALAAARDPEVSAALAGSMETYERAFAEWLAARGRTAPPGAVRVALAALDGLVLRRAVDPALDLSTVAGVLDALLGGARQPPEGEAA